MSTHLRLTQLALAATLGLAVWGTLGMLFSDGTVDMIHAVNAGGPALLPGTTAPLKTHYTGIGPIDRQLTILCIFFRSLYAGSNPEYQLHLFDFAFQFAVQFGLVVIEGSRPGNLGKLVSYAAIWFGVAQNAAIGNTLPVLFLLHLATSPTVHGANLSNILPSTKTLVSLPFSLILGYFVPAFLLNTPSLSYTAQQDWLAVWQAFPLWVAIFQQVISIIITPYTGRGNGTQQVNENVESLRTVYTVLKYMSTFGHIASWGVALKTLEAPKLFASGIPTALHPWNVWAPLGISPSFKVPDIGAGAHIFLQYDRIGSSAAIVIWAFYMYAQTNLKKDAGLVDKAWSLFKTLATVVFIGPAGAAVSLMEARDETVLAQSGVGRKKVI